MCMGSKGSERASANPGRQAPEGGMAEPISGHCAQPGTWILLSVQVGPTQTPKHFRLGEGPRSLPAPSSPLRGATQAPQWVTEGLVSRQRPPGRCVGSRERKQL